MYLLHHLWQDSFITNCDSVFSHLDKNINNFCYNCVSLFRFLNITNCVFSTREEVHYFKIGLYFIYMLFNIIFYLCVIEYLILFICYCIFYLCMNEYLIVLKCFIKYLILFLCYISFIYLLFNYMVPTLFALLIHNYFHCLFDAYCDLMFYLIVVFAIL